MKKTKTFKIRVRDKHSGQLDQLARSVNFVWNYVNELSYRSINERGVFLSAFDLHPYTKGAGKALGLHSQTLQCVAKEYVTRRKQFKKSKLRWRKSFGSKRSLGWVPVNTGAAQWKNGQVYHNGTYFKVVQSPEPATAFGVFSAVIKEMLVQRQSSKHMAGLNLGRLDSTPSLKYQAQE